MSAGIGLEEALDLALRRGPNFLTMVQGRSGIRRGWKSGEIFGSVGGGATLGAPGMGLGGRVVTVGIRAESTEICKELITIAVPKKGVWLPCMIRARAAGCSCCCAACVASVVARCVRAAAARLALDSLEWSSLCGGFLQESRGAVLLVVFGAFECAFVAKAERACVCVAFIGVELLSAEPVEAEAHRLVALCSGEVSQNRCCCPGEGFSQDCSTLVSTVAVLPQSVRCAVGSASAFWLNGALAVLVEVLPGPACVTSVVLLAAVFSRMVCVIGLCILVKVLPRIALCRFWWRFFPEVLCIRFGPLLSCPCDSRDEVSLLPVGLSVLQSAWALSVEVLCAWPCVWLLRCPACLVAHFQVFSAALVGLRVPVAWTVCFVSHAQRALPDGGLVSVVGVWLAVLLVEASVLRWGFPSCGWKRLVVYVSFLCFPLVTRGGDAPLWCCVARVRIVATFWWSHLP
ncbi:hypothetical protein Taro_002892, partial [Colocasia esculenta]|nr:hypothetical protein [Colocasia esculenta]